MRSFKRIMKIVLFLSICLAINGVFVYMLVPNSFIRIKVHNIESEKYDDIFVGSSHGFAAVNPVVVDGETGRKSINLCYGGEYLRDSYYLLKDACRTHTPERVIYELDPGYWVNPDTENPTYAMAYSNMSPSMVKAEYCFAKITDADFRSALFPWFHYRKQYAMVPQNLKDKREESYRNFDAAPLEEPTQVMSDEGFMYIKNSEGEKTKENMVLWDESKVLKEAPVYFDKLVRFCREKEIELVVMTTPVPEETLAEHSENYKEADRYFAGLMEEYGIRYLNFNTMEADGFLRGVEGFSDYEGHMFGDNAENFSRVLAGYLR